MPAVVVVMVAHDPGAWWEETLASLDRQTYANLAVLVVDNASTEPVTERLAAALPHAHVRRLEEHVGFGAAANEAIDAVEGAAFLLVCHDDVRLEPGAVQAMVAEAFRSNAGMVGPKLVKWSDPQHLLQVGMAADKFGVPAPLVEPGEIDQQQHDAVRDVFFVPSAACLVRADLFAALGGFDPGIDFVGEDLDLGWRAHVAGARVLVAPDATVAHRQGLRDRIADLDHRRLEERHALRAVMSDYRAANRWRVLPQAALLTVVEVLYALVQGRLRVGRDSMAAWSWNLRRRREIKARRRAVAAVRTVRDREVRRLQVRGSARVGAAVRRRWASREDRLPELAGTDAGAEGVARGSSRRAAVAAWIAVLAAVAFGSRELLIGTIPAVGQFVSFDVQPVDLLRTWVSGYHGAGLGSDAPNPPAEALFGGAGFLVIGAMGFLRRLLVLGTLPLGLLGVWRLAGPVGSRRARIVALVVYAAAPAPYNAVAAGRWNALVLYALAPWLLAQVARLAGAAPYGARGGSPGPGVPRRPFGHQVVGLALLAALGGALVPVVLPVVVVMLLGVALGGLLVGQVRGTGRLLAGGALGVAGAFVLLLPWSAGALDAGASALAGVDALPAPVMGVGHLLRFATGPAVASALSLLLLPVPALALLIGRGWRLGWAARAWTVAIAAWAAVFCAGQGWIGGVGVDVDVALAVAAAALAWAAAMSAAAFEVDLVGYRFGWRQVASVGAAAALLLGVLPTVVASIDGRWQLPTGDLGTTLERLPGEREAMRMLWLGDASVVPATGWRLGVESLEDPAGDEHLVYLTTSTRTPQVPDLWPGSDAGVNRRIPDAVATAASGATSRLGALLAPFGIQYVIVPDRLAPAPSTSAVNATPRRLLDLLAQQLDLARVDLPSGVTLYRNAAFGPTRAALTADVALPTGGDALGDRVAPALAGAPVALPATSGPTDAAGPVGARSQVFVSTSASDRWSFDVDGRSQAAVPAFGWASTYPAPEAGNATLVYRTPWERYAFVAAQVALWVVACWYLLRGRVNARERGDDD